MDKRIHTAKVRVEFEDCDAMGVVYHPNFFRYIERSRVDYLRIHKIPYGSMLGLGAGLVIAEIHAHYWRPARFEDELFVYTRQIDLSEKRMVLEQFMTRDPLDGAAAIKPMSKISGKVFGARMTLASIDLGTMRAAPLPLAIAKVMEPLTVEVSE